MEQIGIFLKESYLLDIVTGLLLIMIISNRKIRCLSIIEEYFNIYRNDKENKKAFYDYLTFLIFPIIISVILVLKYEYLISDPNLFLTVFSIFTGLLFNFLVLIIPLNNKENLVNDTSKKIVNKEKLKICIKEIYNTVAYEILISLVIIILLIVCENISDEYRNALRVISCITITLMIQFFINLIIVLKRTIIIFDNVKE